MVSVVVIEESQEHLEVHFMFCLTERRETWRQETIVNNYKFVEVIMSMSQGKPDFFIRERYCMSQECRNLLHLSPVVEKCTWRRESYDVSNAY